MKILILIIFICLFFGTKGNVHAQCTSGCTNTITLSSSSQTISYTLSNNETLCIVKSSSLSGNATISSGTLNVNNRPNVTICFGPGVVVALGVNINNPNNQFAINNYGTLQNSLSIGSTQAVLNNYGTVSGSVTMNNGSINNQSGGTFSASNFAMNGGTFVNNSGSSFNLPTSFTVNGGSFSGQETLLLMGILLPIQERLQLEVQPLLLEI
jgi:hypothetical protein